MNLQESIRKILREDKKTKSTNKEFSKYKDSKFNSLRDYTLQDIVNNWESLSDHKNENIKTIRHFIDNPDKITDLVYDGKGLEDGYHRLIAAKILKKPKFTYRLVENLQESIRRILKEETNQKRKNLLNIVKKMGLYDFMKDLGIQYTDFVFDTGELPREIKIQYLKDVINDLEQSPGELDLTFITGSIPLYENDDWQTVYVEYLTNDNNVLRVHLTTFNDDNRDEYDTIHEDDIDYETLETLVSELSEKLQYKRM